MAKGAFEKNQFWKLRKKHGRPRKFKKPEELLNAAYDYFQWCHDHPLIQVVYRSAVRCELQKTRPFTLTGLCLHLRISRHYFYDLKKTYNRVECSQFDDAYYKSLAYAAHRIEAIIHIQQFEGLAVGVFHPRIVGPIVAAYQRRLLAERRKEALKIEPDKSFEILFLNSYSELSNHSIT